MESHQVFKCLMSAAFLAASLFSEVSHARLVDTIVLKEPSTLIDELGAGGMLQIPAVYVFDDQGRGLLAETGMQRTDEPFDERSLQRFSTILQENAPSVSTDKAIQMFKSVLAKRGFELKAPANTRQVLVVELDPSIAPCMECEQTYPRFEKAASQQFVPIRWIRLVLTKPQASAQP